MVEAELGGIALAVVAVTLQTPQPLCPVPWTPEHHSTQRPLWWVLSAPFPGQTKGFPLLVRSSQWSSGVPLLQHLLSLDHHQQTSVNDILLPGFPSCDTYDRHTLHNDSLLLHDLAPNSENTCVHVGNHEVQSSLASKTEMVTPELE